MLGTVCYTFYYNPDRPAKTIELVCISTVPALLLVKTQNQNHKIRTTTTDTVRIS